MTNHIRTEIAPLMPWWHTILVILPIAIGSIASAYQNGLPNMNLPDISSRLSSYYTVLAIECLPVLLIWFTMRRRGFSISTLISGRWASPRKFLKDLGFAVGFVILSVPLIGVLNNLLGAEAALSTTLSKITPKTGFELFVWLVLSATGGFCEELVFRGYLMRQFRGWTNSHVFAIILQGVVFGLAHGYYHKIMIAPMVLGWMLGLLAYWRKSLRPGIIAHVFQDAMGGLISFFS